MADVKKFLDQAGVSVLWSRIAEEIATEKARAEAAESANAAAAKKAQDEVDALETYVGTIPANYTESNIVAFIQKRAQEVLSQAQGGSSETAASVKAALDAYIALNDPKVTKNTGDIATIMGDYLKAADKTELADDIKANADEIIRIDNALKAAVENDGEGLDSIKELATWIETHGTEAAGYAAAIDALELLVGETAVATQIANAIAAENLAQYAKASDLEATNGNVSTLTGKVDTGDKTVSAYVAAAIDAIKIGDYAKASDLTLLAGRVSTNEGKIAELEAADIAIKGRLDSLEGNVSKWNAAEANAKAYADSLAKNYDAAGAAATAETNAKAHTDSEITRRVVALTTAEIEAAIASAQA
jgi:hypothetical protein